MRKRIFESIFLFCLIFMIILPGHSIGRRRGGRTKVQTKILIRFPNATEFSLLNQQTHDPRSPQIFKASHFSQLFRLGGKILLICVSKGKPRPRVRWFKDLYDVPIKDNLNLSEKIIDEFQLFSKIEIDPATLSDGGIFTCVAQNKYGNMHRNYKVEAYM